MQSDPDLLKKAFEDMRQWLDASKDNHAALVIAPTYLPGKGVNCSMIFRGEDDILSVAFLTALENNPLFRDFFYSCLRKYESQKITPKNYS